MIDNGQLVTLGTPQELKSAVGADVIHLRTGDDGAAAQAVRHKMGLAVLAYRMPSSIEEGSVRHLGAAPNSAPGNGGHRPDRDRSVHLGSQLVVDRGGQQFLTAEVKGIETAHKIKIKIKTNAAAGETVGLLLPGLAQGDIATGDVLRS